MITYFIRELWGGYIQQGFYVRCYLRHVDFISFYPLRIDMDTGKGRSSTTYDISLQSNRVVTLTSTQRWEI